MEDKDIIKQIALEVFGSNDGIRPRFPHTGEKIQEAMELSFKAGIKEVVEWIESHEESTCMDCSCAYDFKIWDWQAKLKEWGIE